MISSSRRQVAGSLGRDVICRYKRVLHGLVSLNGFIFLDPCLLKVTVVEICSHLSTYVS